MRQPGLRDVAAAAGVSMSAVSLALNGRPGVSDATRAQILRIAGELGYVAHPGARAMRTGRTSTLAILTRNLSNPYFLDVVVAAQQYADEHDRTLITVDSHYDLDRELLHLQKLLAARVDALAIAPVGAGTSVAAWTERRRERPVVVINAAAVAGDHLVHVGPDDESAVTQAVDHLHTLGHRRIGLLSAPAAVVADRRRLDTFHALTRTGEVEGVVVESPLDQDSVEDTVVELLGDPGPPTALITASDHVAQAVYHAARRLDLRIGHDLSLIGHDDLATSALFDPPLTTLALSRESIGREVARRLGDASVTDDHSEPVHLISRASTRPPA